MAHKYTRAHKSQKLNSFRLWLRPFKKAAIKFGGGGIRELAAKLTKIEKPLNRFNIGYKAEMYYLSRQSDVYRSKQKSQSWFSVYPREWIGARVYSSICVYYNDSKNPYPVPFFFLMNGNTIEMCAVTLHTTCLCLYVCLNEWIGMANWTKDMIIANRMGPV